MLYESLETYTNRVMVATGLSNHIRARLEVCDLETVTFDCDESGGRDGESIEFRFFLEGRRLPMLLSIDKDGGTMVVTPIGDLRPAPGVYRPKDEVAELLVDTMAQLMAFSVPGCLTVH